jgi:hypothetical protein
MLDKRYPLICDSIFAELDTIIVRPDGESVWTTAVALEVASFYTDLDGAWEITHVYGDGVIRIAEGDGPNDLFRFIRPDGTVGKPKTWALVHALMNLLDSGHSITPDRELVAA